MLALFRSFLEPLAILAGVALSLVGVFWGLFLGGSSINVLSLLGIMMLIGIAVANSIVLVSFAKERLAEGASPAEAMLEAGKTRMRPILMTAAATMLGLLPTALHTGMHAEANTPLAQAVIGGLLVATLTTLVVVPILWIMALRTRAPQPEGADTQGVLALATGRNDR
jgi:multidrug efflux pump subunit AcrB